MDKANDAKFVKLCGGPNYFSAPKFFKPKNIFIIIIFLFSCSFVFAKKGYYEEKDIPVMMSNLFDYHIEYKQLNEKLVRQMVKYYIEQFDFDKMYLLENEADEFYDISDAQASLMVDRINRGDFSDFDRYNQIFATSIKRARSERIEIKKDISESVASPSIIDSDKSSYVNSKKQLAARQKKHFSSFYKFQKKRLNIDSLERKNKVFDLYNKKMSRFENDFALDGKSDLNQHNFVLHFLKAFAKSLDAHTYFFSEDEARDMRVSLEKNFEGIGVVLSETIDGVMISDMIKNSPAKESKKVKVGDLIVEINHQNVEKLTFDEVLKAMKRKDNGKIELGLKGKKSSAITRIVLTARPISMDDDRLTYSYETFEDGIIGKLVLKSFYENQDGVSSERDIKDAIRQLKEIGDLKGVVLDFRENAGGFLSQAVKVAGLFMSNGVVVMSKYSTGDVKYLRTIEGAPYYNGPLVILTSKMSASAAEIVAQALQDFGVALVVGDQRTFGKGSIQYQTVTNENAKYFFKVTIGRYYTASGKSTQINGVIADIVIPTRYSPFEVGEKYLENSLPPDAINSAYKDTLSDLDPKLKKLFQRGYLPSLQKVVAYWKNMLPTLKEKSKQRLENSTKFRSFLEYQDQIREKLNGADIEITDKSSKYNDLQMDESVNIVKDMIIIEAQSMRALDKQFESSQK